MDLIKISIFLIVLIKCINKGSACPPWMKLLPDKEGIPECFTCSECPAGIKKIDDCTYEHDTVCDECTDEEFYHSESQQCKTCTVCDAGYYIQRNCTNFKDAECDVCPSGTYSDDQNSSTCKSCTKCSGSKVLFRNCNNTVDTYCGECTDDEYYASSSLQCKTCAVCDAGYYIKRNCSRFNDAECDFCPSGSFSSDRDSYTCFNCTKCIGAQVEIRKCRETADTLCGGASEENETLHLLNIVAFSVAVPTEIVIIILCMTHVCRHRGNKENDAENGRLLHQKFRRDLKEIYRSMIYRYSDEIFGEPFAQFNMTHKIPGQSHERKIKHIFKDYQTEFRWICVIGADSVGKTTLCRTLLRDYCNSDNQHFKDRFGRYFYWIFFISLNHFLRKTNVQDMIKCRYFKACETKFTNILQTNKEVLIVLDDFDEWAVLHPSATLDLTEFEENKNFTVLITTRQSGLNQLKDSDKVLKFDREIRMTNITSMAVTNLQKKMINKINRQNEKTVSIEDVRITAHPLLLKQLVIFNCKYEIREHLDEPLCTTFKKIVANWLSESSSQENERLKSLLGKVSFDTLIKKDSTFFNSIELRSAGFSVEMLTFCLNIGLLSQGLDNNDEPDNISIIKFAHILYLYYFAAVHMVVDTDCVNVFLEKCKTAKQLMKLRFVLIFFSGMNSPDIKQVLIKIQQVLDYEEAYLNSNFVHRSLLNIQSLALDCISEVQHTHLDFSLKTVYICSDTFDRNRTFSFSTFLKALQKCNALQSAVFDLYKRMENQLEKMLLETIKLKSIIFTTLKMKGFGCMPYLSYLKSDKVSKLVCLQISDIEVNHSNKKQLTTCVEKAVSIRELDLTQIRCADHKEQCPCSFDLLKCSNLVSLSLRKVKLCWVRVNTSCLTNCEITDTPIFYSPAAEKFKSSRELKLNNINDLVEVNSFANLLLCLSDLTYIEVRCSDFGDTVIKLPKTAVSLKMIVLSRVVMTNDALIQFIDSIPQIDIVCKFHDVKHLNSVEDISRMGFEVTTNVALVANGRYIEFKRRNFESS